MEKHDWIEDEGKKIEFPQRGINYIVFISTISSLFTSACYLFESGTFRSFP